MFHRLKTLVAMQLANRLAFSIKRNKGRVIAGIAVKVTLFWVDFPDRDADSDVSGFNLHYRKYDPFAGDSLFTQIFAIIACTIGLMNTLYTSKDNAILWRFPPGTAKYLSRS